MPDHPTHPPRRCGICDGPMTPTGTVTACTDCDWLADWPTVHAAILAAADELDARLEAARRRDTDRRQGFRTIPPNTNPTRSTP